MKKPELSYWKIWNMSFGFLGVQIGFALQNANISRIFQELGASLDTLPLLWLAAPLTGFIAQPLVGHFSDRTWGPLGRRRPYFLAGATLTACALIFLPSAPSLVFAAAGLWLLDASLNLTMEPFRAFVGDNLPDSQRALGFGLQTVFIGAGAVLASLAPFALTEIFHVANHAAPGHIPDSVRFSFYIGALALAAAIGWTIVSSREYSPQERAAFTPDAASDRPRTGEPEARVPGGNRARLALLFLVLGAVLSALIIRAHGDPQLFILGFGLIAAGLVFLLALAIERFGGGEHFIAVITRDLAAMPGPMQRLAVVQFFSWSGLFLLWIYSTPAIALRAFGASDALSPAYEAAANWNGVLASVYNGVAALYAFFIPALARRIGIRNLHSLSLLIGAAGLGGLAVIGDRHWLLAAMIGVGIGWGAILTLPYARLSAHLPTEKMGVYMGIFNFFIVLPQIMAAGVFGPILRLWLGGAAPNALLAAAGAFTLAAALNAAFRIEPQRVS